MEDSLVALLACMQEVKVAIDAAFVKGVAESSGVAFSAWLQVELGQFF